MARARKDWLEWYRVDRDLWEHPKLTGLAQETGLDREIAMARLHRFWSWVARYAPRGTMSECELQTACETAQISPASALTESGFVDVHRGGFRVHDWWEMNGHPFKERIRKRLENGNHRGDSAEVPRHNYGEIQAPGRATETDRSTETEKAQTQSPGFSSVAIERSAVPEPRESQNPGANAQRPEANRNGTIAPDGSVWWNGAWRSPAMAEHLGWEGVE